MSAVDEPKNANNVNREGMLTDMDPCVCTSAGANSLDRLLSPVLALVPLRSFPHSPHFLSSPHFSPFHPHLPTICGRTNKQPCPPAATLPTNGSSHSHDPSSSNITLLSRSYPTTTTTTITLSTSVDLRVSKYRHVGCREKQGRRRRPTPETTQCLDPLSLRQAPRAAPSPSRPAETDPGGGVQDHLGTMAVGERRRARRVRAARRDGQGGSRAIVPQLSLRADEEGRQGSHSRGKAPGQGTGTCWPKSTWTRRALPTPSYRRTLQRVLPVYHQTRCTQCSIGLPIDVINIVSVICDTLLTAVCQCGTLLQLNACVIRRV
jgi:hypothetical protein